MRIIALALVAAVAAGCGDQRSFDERFSDSENEIEQRAAEIDEGLNTANAGQEPSTSDRE